MDKKTLIAIGISLVVLLVWQVYFTPVPPKVPEHDNFTIAATENATTTPMPVAADNASSPINKVLNEKLPTEKIVQPVSFKNDKIEIFFDPTTGDVRKASILGWKDEEDDYVTFNKNGGYNYGRIITPIASGYTQDVKNIDNGKVISYTSSVGDLVVMKEYTLVNGSYLVDTKVKISNAGNVSLNVPIQVKVGPNLGDGFEDSKYIFEGAVISSQKKTERVKADKTSTEELATPFWAGYTSKYFLMAAAGGNFQKALIAPEMGGEVASMETAIIINPGDRASQDFQFYVGPKEYKGLKSLGLGLQSSIDFGWFYFLAIPMLQIMLMLYGFVHNYGVAIIILTIIIKVITLPLTMKGMKSMKAMSKLQPEMVAIKEKFKGDPQKMNVATMELYKKNKVNPMSGCLPLLIQIPIFFALYKALLLSIELKDAPFFGWITDLSAKDPYYITPIIMGISMFIQQKMTPSTADPMQQKIFLIMPIVFTFLFLNFPSGLVIYWLTNNLLSIAQQYIVNKKSA